MQSGLASAKRVFEFLDTPEEIPAPGLTHAAVSPNVGQGQRLGQRSRRRVRRPCRPVPGRVLLRSGLAPANQDFTLEAAPGRTVAIVGSTEAGKTTVVNLLMRFYEIDSGRILLDGVDYRDLSRDEVRRCSGWFSRASALMAGGQHRITEAATPALGGMKAAPEMPAP